MNNAPAGHLPEKAFFPETCSPTTSCTPGPLSSHENGAFRYAPVSEEEFRLWLRQRLQAPIEEGLGRPGPHEHLMLTRAQDSLGLGPSWLNFEVLRKHQQGQLDSRVSDFLEGRPPVPKPSRQLRGYQPPPGQAYPDWAPQHKDVPVRQRAVPDTRGLALESTPPAAGDITWVEVWTDEGPELQPYTVDDIKGIEEFSHTEDGLWADTAEEFCGAAPGDAAELLDSKHLPTNWNVPNEALLKLVVLSEFGRKYRKNYNSTQSDLLTQLIIRAKRGLWQGTLETLAQDMGLDTGTISKAVKVLEGGHTTRWQFLTYDKRGRVGESFGEISIRIAPRRLTHEAVAELTQKRMKKVKE